MLRLPCMRMALCLLPFILSRDISAIEQDLVTQESNLLLFQPDEGIERASHNGLAGAIREGKLEQAVQVTFASTEQRACK